VRYVLKDYPLDAECNANVANTIHPSACEAAVAVRLARTHNREEAMIEWIFANQPMLTPELVKQGARDVGQVTDFDAKYASTLESVKSDIALGKQLGVGATPRGEALRAGGPPGIDHLPESGFDLEAHVKEIERGFLAQALKRAGGVQVKAAELLGMSFRSFRYYEEVQPAVVAQDGRRSITGGGPAD